MVHFAEINQAPPPDSLLQYIDRVATTLIMGGGALVSEFMSGIVEGQLKPKLFNN